MGSLRLTRDQLAKIAKGDPEAIRQLELLLSTVNSISGGGGGGPSISAGTQLATSGTVILSNANNVTFGMAGSATVTASVASSLTNIRVSAGTTSNNLSAVTFSNSNGVTFGLNASTITASHNGITSQSVQTQGIQAVAVQGSAGVGSTQTSGTLAFQNTNGFSWHMGTNNSVQLFATLSTNMFLQGNTLGTDLFSGTLLKLAGGSNITLSGDSAGSGMTIIGAAGGLNVSAGTTSNNLSNLTFSNSNGITFGLNGSTITASHNALTSQSNQALSAANGSFTFQTATFANSNGVSFSTGTQGIFASHNGITSQSNQQMTLFATGNTTQSSSGTSNASSLIFAGSGIASVGITGGSVLISVPSGGGGLTNINISAGTTSNNLSNITFANSNGVTFGLNASTITASVAAGPTVSMFPQQPWPWATSTMYTGATTTVGGGSSSTLSWYIAPLIIDEAITFNDVKAIINAGATVAGTGSASYRHVLGIYTRNASTLSLVTSFAWNAAHSQSSVTAHTLTWWPGAWSASTTNSSSISGNVSASISGLREIRLNATSSASSLAASHYFLAHAYMQRTTSSALFNLGSAWRYSVSQFTGAFGFSNTTGPFMGMPWNGIASTVTTTPTQFEFVAPASIHSSAITATGGTTRNQWPIVVLQSATA